MAHPPTASNSASSQDLPLPYEMVPWRIHLGPCRLSLAFSDPPRHSRLHFTRTARSQTARNSSGKPHISPHMWHRVSDFPGCSDVFAALSSIRTAIGDTAHDAAHPCRQRRHNSLESPCLGCLSPLLLTMSRKSSMQNVPRLTKRVVVAYKSKTSGLWSRSSNICSSQSWQFACSRS